MWLRKKRALDEAKRVRQGCGFCFRVVDAEDGGLRLRQFKRCSCCGRTYHADCTTDHCPMPSCSGVELTPVPPGAVPRAGRFDARKRAPIVPRQPVASLSSAAPPRLEALRRPRRLRRRFAEFLVLGLLFLGLIMADLGGWRPEAPWLNEVNQERLHVRSQFKTKLREAVIGVRKACDHFIEVLSDNPVPAAGGARSTNLPFGLQVEPVSPWECLCGASELPQFPLRYGDEGHREQMRLLLTHV